MPHLAQGCIVRANVYDQQGRNPKIRPLVVVTASSEIEAGGSLVAVAVTGRRSEPPAEDEVELPWHREGAVRTRLRKPSVAKCSWLCEIRREDIVAVMGIVPPVPMEQIVKTIAELDNP